MGKTAGMVELPVASLVPYERNAKLHPQDQVEKIAASIREFGFLSPCLVDRAGNIIAGHGRVEAAKSLGMETVPCVYVDGLSEEQRRAYILADNRLTELGGWDWEMVADELEAIDLGGIDVTLTGFDEIIDHHIGGEVEEDEFDPEEVGQEPRTAPGDIWALGEHRLVCGDATDPSVIDRVLAGVRARVTVTSPPYGVGKDYEEKGIEPWRATIGGVINAIKGKTLIICWNIGDLFSTGTQFTEPTGAYSVNLMAEAGYGMLYTRIWKKPGANFAGNNPYYTVTTKPAQDYEYLYAFAEKDAFRHVEPLIEYLSKNAKVAGINDALVKSLGGPGFMCGHWFTNHQWAFIDKKNYELIKSYCKSNGIDAFERDYDDLRREYLENTIFSRALTDDDFSEWGLYGVWEMNTVHERLGGHAAAFPIELPARYIKMHSYEGSIVLDPFGGTGTTLIACEQLNRRCRMVELDPHYCDVIVERWENATGRKAEKHEKH